MGQVSKPIAKSIAQRAKNSPFFKNWICIPVAQAFHFYEVQVKMKALNLGSGRVTKVPKLSETQAVQQGAELLSEIIILSIASGILVFEYNRSKEKEEAKEEKIKADRETIKDKIYNLEVKVEKQSVQIRNLAKTAIHLEEEIQRKSLKRLIGSNAEIPEELIKTVQENPEVPKEVKPLEWLVDKVEKIESKEAEMKEKELQNHQTGKTPIQEIVEKHYSRPTSTEKQDSVQMSDSEENNAGIITGKNS